MTNPHRALSDPSGRPVAALRRLQSLAPLDAGARAAVEAAIQKAQSVSPHSEIIAEGETIQGQKLIVSGWVARVRQLSDGRRQILGFLLPGELIGVCHQPEPLAVSTVVALSDAMICTAPSARISHELARAYAISHALDEAQLLASIMRLGRLDAYERIIDLLLEFNERLALSGLATGGNFALPLTQEIMADALGLTAVHVNRMLQRARNNGELTWRGGQVALRDPATLAEAIGHQPARVSKALG
jgi:CRP-like cAMP-binding protein